MLAAFAREPVEALPQALRSNGTRWLLGANLLVLVVAVLAFRAGLRVIRVRARTDGLFWILVIIAPFKGPVGPFLMLSQGISMARGKAIRNDIATKDGLPLGLATIALSIYYLPGLIAMYELIF